jgi:hypothetical protein
MKTIKRCGLVTIDVCRQAPELDVVGQDAHDGRLIDRPTAGVGREQDLLLEPKMLPALRLPKLQERSSRLLFGGWRRPLQLQRDVEPLMVLA